jgi:hypothetical protein
MDHFTASFWNLSGRDLVVNVGGRSSVLTPGCSMPAAVGQEFLWQIEGRAPQKQTIAPGESALEIVIRR